MMSGVALQSHLSERSRSSLDCDALPLPDACGLSRLAPFSLLSFGEKLTDDTQYSVGYNVPYSGFDYESLCHKRHQLYAALSQPISCLEHHSYDCHRPPFAYVQISHCCFAGTKTWDTVHIDRCYDHRIRRNLLHHFHYFPCPVRSRKSSFTSVPTVPEPIPGETRSVDYLSPSHPSDRQSPLC